MTDLSKRIRLFGEKASASEWSFAEKVFICDSATEIADRLDELERLKQVVDTKYARLVKASKAYIGIGPDGKKASVKLFHEQVEELLSALAELGEAE